MEYSGPRIFRSDKYYWHRYTEMYEPLFASLPNIRLVVEFGVLDGDSIAWLAKCFPQAALIGVDIVPQRLSWPQSPRIRYIQADQGERGAIRNVFAQLPDRPDLVLEDGSHIPQHQVSCLIEGFRRLRPGGLYILEDIGTSHPLTEAFRRYSRLDGVQSPTALHVLLALQHLRDIGGDLTPELAHRLSDSQFFAESEIRELFDQVGEIQLYKRTKLPLRCYACGGNAFDYIEWRCKCGTDLYNPVDSMTCLVWKKARSSP